MALFSESRPATLLLEDGTIYHGKAIGQIGTTTGEICFNTGMTGYQEVFTDPSYFGQIMVTTHPHIGNYGVLEDETESSAIQIAGLVCKNFNVGYSRKQATEELNDYFKAQKLVGISNIDTRALVTHIRNKGAMNAIISSDITDIDQLKVALTKVPSMDGLELSTKVTTQQPYYYGDKENRYRVAVLDLGVKKNILRNFSDRNIYSKVFPAQTTFEEMEQFKPHGYFLSNGPGDPAAMPYAVETVKQILATDKPLFGICLGHQILALANEIQTMKMFNGHRGLNHPVKNLKTSRCEITSQNHGFGVVPEQVRQSKLVEITHINLNDQSIEGIKIKNKPAFSVQYHPESSPGPHDSRYLFDEFLSHLKTQAFS